MILWLYKGGGSLSICLFGESKLHLFQADAVQNQEMLQKAYEAANRVKLFLHSLGPLLCFGTIDNCPKTIFLSLILSNTAIFLAASPKIKTLPKAKRTRGLSSYHKMTVHSSQILNLLQFQNLD